MKREDVLARIAELNLLTPLPNTVDDVRKAADSASSQSQFPIRDVAAIVCADPAVTGAILSIANCSPYGLPGQIANINLAVTILGTSGTCGVANQFKGLASLPDSAKFDFKPFWVRSMYCATAAMSIAKAADRGEVGDAYTAGLLHEIGRLAFASAIPDAYARVSPEMPDEQRVEAERALFGITHSEAGFMMASKWKLPSSISETIKRHHDEQETRDTGELVAIVRVAAAMADAYVREATLGDCTARCRDALKHLLMDGATLTRIYDKTADTIDGISRQRS